MLPACALAELVTSQNFNILLLGTYFKHALQGFQTGLCSVKEVRGEPCHSDTRQTRSSDPLKQYREVSGSQDFKEAQAFTPVTFTPVTFTPVTFTPGSRKLCQFHACLLCPFFSPCAGHILSLTTLPAPNCAHQFPLYCELKMGSASGAFLAALEKPYKAKQTTSTPEGSSATLFRWRQDVHGCAVPLQTHMGISLPFICYA